ncbi:MAG TPA: pilus assembly protein TadG-related protein [Candidatus Binatia bacterium]|nr:pilus assembly protein TadG-related protein [Candidatus Binatia bacterium]
MLLLTTALVVPVVLILAGLAMDVAYLGEVKNEIQRAMDAAALAGAGNLGFNASSFPAALAAAADYALLNPFRVGTISLAPSPGNLDAPPAPGSGNIVLGIWDSTTGTFSASLDGTRVNAVKCQYATTIPTTFLRLVGLTSLPVSAQAIAISNPPANPGCGEPILPIGVTPCAFYDGSTGAFNNSTGCGTGLTWISSNRICDNSAGSPQTCNSAAWVSLDGSTPNTSYLRQAIQNAGSPSQTCNVSLNAGDSTTLNNGMIDTVFNDLRDTFLRKRGDPPQPLPSGDILRSDGTVAYRAEWGGWETGVMMVQSSCPPGAMSGSRSILTYAKFVVTQVYDQNRGCVASPNQDPQAAPYCAVRDPNLRAVFGYFRCDQFGQVATLDPVPRAALAPRLRLVR